MLAGKIAFYITHPRETVNGDYHRNQFLPIFKAAMDLKNPRTEHNTLMLVRYFKPSPNKISVRQIDRENHQI